MRFVSLIISLIIINFHSSGQNLQEFKELLHDCDMHITIPPEFEESSVKENGDMDYDYAIKYPDKDFELRYAIRPIRYKNYANDTIRREIESQRGFRNSAYGTVLQTIILNITGGIDYKIQVFDKDAVKKEFNADWGATSFVDLHSDFGKGFKYCMIVTIHKNDVADAYYFYLSNSKDKFSENMEPLFHTLQFNP
jgi:hypothetical protein